VADDPVVDFDDEPTAVEEKGDLVGITDLED